MFNASNDLDLLPGIRRRQMPLEDTVLAPVVDNETVKSKRRVNFHEARIVALLTPLSCISEKEKFATWYDTATLDDFKTQARTLCRKLRYSPDDIESTRGLEHRLCLNRQRNKQLALRCVLKAQLRSNCPDFLASISSRCTAYAKYLALNEATRDFCEVYYPHLAIIPPVIDNAYILPTRPSKRGCEEREHKKNPEHQEQQEQKHRKTKQRLC